MKAVTIWTIEQKNKDGGNHWYGGYSSYRHHNSRREAREHLKAFVRSCPDYFFRVVKLSESTPLEEVK